MSSCPSGCRIVHHCDAVIVIRKAGHSSSCKGTWSIATGSIHVSGVVPQHQVGYNCMKDITQRFAHMHRPKTCPSAVAWVHSHTWREQRTCVLDPSEAVAVMPDILHVNLFQSWNDHSEVIQAAKQQEHRREDAHWHIRNQLGIRDVVVRFIRIS